MGKKGVKCMWCLKETCKHSGVYCSRACGDAYRSSMSFPPDYPAGVRLEYMGKEQQAWLRGKGWHLTPSEFLSFSGGYCHYCGDPVGDGVGIDRLDSSRGYEVGNIVRCCGECNMVKHVLSHDEFIKRCIKVAMRHGSMSHPDVGGSSVPGMLSRLSGYLLWG